VRKFGFTNPVLIDDEDRIIAGHGRVEAATHLGLAAIPTLPLSHLSDAENCKPIVVRLTGCQRQPHGKPVGIDDRVNLAR
jgi:hypothetical protein